MTLDRIVFMAVAFCLCVMMWRLPRALRPDEENGSTATFDFTSRFGTHHVLMQLGTAEERDAAIRRHIEDFLALKKAIDGVP